jgi:large subunit ribosomal protein L20
MPRVRKGSARKQGRKRLLNATKGYWGGRGNLFKKASETYVRAMAFAYRDRKCKKRDFRKLWIIRINAVSSQFTRSGFNSSFNKNTRGDHHEINA